MNKKDDQIIGDIINLMRSDRSVDAPPDAVQWSKNLFRAGRTAPQKSVVEKVLAVLKINLSGDRPAFGERSAAGAPAAQMLFQAGETALDIRISKADRNFNLHGQILGADFSGGVVQVSEFETAINEVGEFKLTNLAKGNHRLTVRKNDKEIVVERLEIK